MRATVYVTSTPYVGTSDADGRYTFDKVIPGKYTLARFDQGKRIEKTVEVAGPRVELSIR